MSVMSSFNVIPLILKPRASAGSRTRIDCLEGNHANRYTTDATHEFKCTPSQLKRLGMCTEGKLYPDKCPQIAFSSYMINIGSTIQLHNCQKAAAVEIICLKKLVVT